MSGYIKTIERFGEQAFLFGNSRLEAVLLPGRGSQLIEMRHKQTGLHIMRHPETERDYRKNPLLYGIPVLFPPNRIDGGRFTYRDRIYQFNVNEEELGNHIHGLVHDLPWKAEPGKITGETVRISTSLDSREFPSVGEQFPHPFILKIDYKLTESGLKMEVEVHNKGQEPFPWGLGFHTAFRFPIGSGTSQACELSLPVKKHWKLNQRNLPTGAFDYEGDTAEIREGSTLEGNLYDDVYSADFNAAENEAVISNREAGMTVKYRCSREFGHWVLFNGDGRELTGFVCPEPYTWVTNAPNLNLPESETGLREIGPEQSVRLSTAIIIEESMPGETD